MKDKILSSRNKKRYGPLESKRRKKWTMKQCFRNKKQVKGNIVLQKQKMKDEILRSRNKKTYGALESKRKTES